MAIDLKILGWSAQGLRCPDHMVSFEKEDDSVYKISLLQMPNGTGKTTVLNLIRAAFVGPEIWVEGFTKPIELRKSRDYLDGQFELILLVNERRLTIKMLFDFTDNIKPKYVTTTQHGKEDGFRPPSDLRPFLTPEFVKLLIFDGELATQLLDSKYTKAQQAIEGMYQLSIFNTMKDRIDEYWKSIANVASSTGGDKERSRRSNKVDKLKTHIQSVESSFKIDMEELEVATSKLDNLDQDFEEEIKKNKDDEKKLNSAIAKVDEAKQILSEKTKELVRNMKNPVELSSNFSDSILSLKESLDRVKLPGIAAREFFIEIADEPKCICDRPIDTIIKKVIIKGADKYLGSDEVAVLNAMKSDIKDRGSINHSLLKNQVSNVEEAVDSLKIARQTLEAVGQFASDQDPAVKRIHVQISDLRELIGKLKTEMEKYSDLGDDSDDCWNPEILQKLLKNAEKELAASTGTIDLKAKRDIIEKILSKAYNKSKLLLSERICEAANDKIKTLMPENDIRIESIGQSLKLANKEGGSAGETLTTGYAFLSSLLSNSEHLLPFVVDSPFGPIDLDIRPEISIQIPKLSDQFISFIISSEREGVIEPLLDATSEEILFLTIYKNKNKKSAIKLDSKIHHTETIDGTCVSGLSFFNQFQTCK